MDRKEILGRILPHVASMTGMAKERNSYGDTLSGEMCVYTHKDGSLGCFMAPLVAEGERSQHSIYPLVWDELGKKPTLLGKTLGVKGKDDVLWLLKVQRTHDSAADIEGARRQLAIICQEEGVEVPW